MIIVILKAQNKLLLINFMERKTFLLYILQLPFSGYLLKNLEFFNKDSLSNINQLNFSNGEMSNINIPVNWRPLTKSRFISALECPTKLYYDGKSAEYINLSTKDEFLQALAEGGYQVGELAKYYYPNGYDIKEPGYKIPLERTNTLLSQTNVTIYEAAIRYNNFFIRIDILNKIANKLEIIEVKAKSFDPNSDSFINKSGYLSSEWKSYLYDVAFQVWVTKHTFPNFEVEPFLYICDKSKVATVSGLNQIFRVKKNKGEIDVFTNFTKEQISQLIGDEILIKVPVAQYVNMIFDGTDTAPNKKDSLGKKDFDLRVQEYSDFYKNDKKYPITIGSKCKGCEFKNSSKTIKLNLKSGYEECWKSKYINFDVNKPHVFDIWNYRQSQKNIDQNIYYLEDLYSDEKQFKTLNERQQLQVNKTVQNDLSEHINPLLHKEIDSWKFPLNFIDFETSIVAIPFYKGKHPYEQIAFQFSCHTLYKNGEIKHYEWLGSTPGIFPNYEFVRQLKSVLEKNNGTIFRYAAHENTILRIIRKQMVAEKNVDLKVLIEWIDTITEWREKGRKNKIFGNRNMVDMLALIRMYYYHPLMKGSNSIKSVLPSIFSTSEYIKNRYSSPVGYGINLSDKVFWSPDENGKPYDPYKLLTNYFDSLDLSVDEIMFEGGKIQDGTAAMIAYAQLQFSVMTEKERNAIILSLLQYCELDTLAMLMIYEHWVKNKV